VVTDSRHNRVKLNHISRQSGQSSGRGVDTRASCQSQDGGGGSGFCDDSAAATVAWARHMQQDKSDPLHWRSSWYQDPWDIQLVGEESNSLRNANLDVKRETPSRSEGDSLQSPHYQL